MARARSNGAIDRQTSVEEKLFPESNFLRILGVVRRYDCPRRLNRHAYLAQRLGRAAGGPGMRNVLVMAPYFQDGSQATQWDVLDD